MVWFGPPHRNVQYVKMLGLRIHLGGHGQLHKMAYPLWWIQCPWKGQAAKNERSEVLIPASTISGLRIHLGGFWAHAGSAMIRISGCLSS